MAGCINLAQYCDDCGFENRDDAKFCNNCGFHMTDFRHQIRLEKEKQKWIITELDDLNRK